MLDMTEMLVGGDIIQTNHTRTLTLSVVVVRVNVL